MTPQELSSLLTDRIVAVPGVHSLIPPGPALAVLVRDPSAVLRLPRDGGLVLVRETPAGLRVRAVVGVGTARSAVVTTRAVRDEIVAAVQDATGAAPAVVQVRVVEIG